MFQTNYYFTDHADDDLFDFDLCRIKERRAHEEVISGKYRHPNYNNIPGGDTTSLEDFEDAYSSGKLGSNSDTISDISQSEVMASTSIQSERLDTEDASLIQRNLQPPKFLLPSLSTESGAASKNPSVTDDGETTENIKSCDRSDSYNSMPSTVSSLSLDSQIEESSYDFMKKFVKILFNEEEDVTPELKSEFGRLAMVSNQNHIQCFSLIFLF